MKRLLLALGLILIVGLFVLAIFIVLNWSGSKVPPSTDANIATSSSTIFPSSAQMGTSQDQTQTNILQNSTSSSEGVSAQVKDFFQDPATVQDPVNPGHYYLGYHFNEGVPDPTATDNPPYVIEYISSTQYFNISLLQEPIGQTRKEAEQYLMAHTGLTEDQMCNLKYMVSVPNRVNQIYAGASLGFSFCPGAVQL